MVLLVLKIFSYFYLRNPTPVDEALKITDKFFLNAQGKYPKEEKELEIKIYKKVKLQ